MSLSTTSPDANAEVSTFLRVSKLLDTRVIKTYLFRHVCLLYSDLRNASMGARQQKGQKVYLGNLLELLQCLPEACDIQDLFGHDNQKLMY